MFYSTSSCKCQYELIAFFFFFFKLQRLMEEAKSQRNCMTPLKQQFGINKFSIQFTTFLNLFTRKKKKKRKAILLNFIRINMYIYCPCLLEHTVFYKQTFLIPFKINLCISYRMCLVWLETDAHAFVLLHTKYTALIQKTSNIQISCVVLRCHIKAVDSGFFSSCKQIFTHPFPQTKI